jgi:hypothetical protein
MAQTCPYVVPVKIDGTQPMPVPPIVKPEVKYYAPLDKHQRRRNMMLFATGKASRRGHGRHRKKREQNRRYRLEEQQDVLQPITEGLQSASPGVEGGGGRVSYMEIHTGAVLQNTQDSPLKSEAWAKRGEFVPLR